jgi:hypothetical protein
MEMDIKETKGDSEDWNCSEQGPLAGSYEHGKETSCFVEGGRNVCSNRQILAFQGGLHS